MGGCSSSAIGTALGGANAGAQGARFSGFRVLGFGTGITVLRSGLHTGGLAFRDCTISHNSTGVLDTEGDTAHISFDACQFYGNGTAISSTASLRISNSRIESSSLEGVLCSAPASCDLNDNHFENGTADSTHFLEGNGIFFVSGGDMRDDRAIGNTDWWAHFAGASFFILGTMLSSTGRTANCGLLNEGAGAAALQNNSANILTTLYSSSSLITDLGSTHRLSGDQQHSGGIRADISSSKN